MSNAAKMVRTGRLFRSLGSTLIRLMDVDIVKSKPVVEPAAQLNIGATFTIKAPVPFSVRSEPGVGKPDGPSRLAGSNLLPPVPQRFW
jgi:hypothetical protein